MSGNQASEFSRLVEDFGRDPQSAGRALRIILKKDPASFYFLAMELLRNYGEEAPGKQYLVALLWTADLLIEPLLDPSEFTPSQAIRLAQAIQSVEPQFDVVLARQIAGSDPRRQTERSSAQILRALEIIGQVSDVHRLMAVLLSLLTHSDPRVRSKAMMLAARSSDNSRWIRNHLETAEPRVRANAIEGMWGVDSPVIRDTLLAFADDRDNRVAGNALVGLHRLGDTRAIPMLMRMAEHPEARFRDTAAWAMGATADQRFMPLLKQMLAKGPAGNKRPLVLAGLRRILQAEEQSHRAGAFGVRVLGVDARVNQIRRVRFVVSPPDGATLTEILPTQVIASLNDQPIRQYSLRRSLKPDPQTVIFALPCVAECRDPLDPHLLAAVRACLDMPLPPALWGIVWYHPSGDARPAPDPRGGEVHLSPNSVPLRTMLAKTVDARQAAPSLGAALALIARKIEAQNQSGHVIALVDPVLDTEEHGRLRPAVLLKAAIGAKVAKLTTHAVVLVDTAPALTAVLKECCQATGGQMVSALRSEKLLSACQAVYAGLRGCYELNLSLPDGMASGEIHLRLQVATPEGYGEGGAEWREGSAAGS